MLSKIVLTLLAVVGGCSGVVSEFQSPVPSSPKRFAPSGINRVSFSRRKVALRHSDLQPSLIPLTSPPTNEEVALLLPRGGHISDNDDDEEGIIPPILRPWIYLYRRAPELHIPGTSLDVGFTLVSAAFLTCCDLLSARALHAAGWPPASSEPTRAAAGSVATILHSSVLVPSLGACLATQPFGASERIDAAPAWWRDASYALIQFCTGYMAYDAAVQFLYDRWCPDEGRIVLSASDRLFLGHHAATALYMTSARLVGAGHHSAMILMFFGEMTAPVQNVVRLSRLASEIGLEGGGGAALRAIGPYVSWTFALLYVFFRTFVGPACAAHLTHDFLFTERGRENVPIGLSLVWLAMCWGVIIGSAPWIVSALRILGVVRNNSEFT